MAADHTINFPDRGVLQQSFCNQHVVSFQSGSVSGATGFSPGGMCSSDGIYGTTGMILTGNSRMLNNISPMVSNLSTSISPADTLLDPSHGPKHCTKVAVDWMYEELEVLKRGLARYATEPTIMKYVKIAATLPDKTVRDVAMRCRWMTKKENSKRRKPDGYFAGKKIKDRKEKIIGTSTMANMHCNQPESAASYSFTMCDGNRNNQFLCEATPMIDSRTQNLLEDNVKLFRRIAVNLESNEIQSNIDLLYRSKENITAILNGMSGMPGIMSQMPPLPVYVDENLMHSILPGTSQAHAPGNGHFKEEPRCWYP